MEASQLGFNPNYSEQAPSIDEINAMQGLAILEFGTSWCEHCQAASPAVKEVLSNESFSHIKVMDGKGKILGRLFKVKLWPTLILLKDGSEIARVVRPVSASEVKSFIKTTNN